MSNKRERFKLDHSPAPLIAYLIERTLVADNGVCLEITPDGRLYIQQAIRDFYARYPATKPAVKV